MSLRKTSTWDGRSDGSLVKYFKGRECGLHWGTLLRDK